MPLAQQLQLACHFARHHIEAAKLQVQRSVDESVTGAQERAVTSAEWAATRARVRQRKRAEARARQRARRRASNDAAVSALHASFQVIITRADVRRGGGSTGDNHVSDGGDMPPGSPGLFPVASMGSLGDALAMSSWGREGDNDGGGRGFHDRPGSGVQGYHTTAAQELDMRLSAPPSREAGAQLKLRRSVSPVAPQAGGGAGAGAGAGARRVEPTAAARSASPSTTRYRPRRLPPPGTPPQSSLVDNR